MYTVIKYSPRRMMRSFMKNEVKVMCVERLKKINHQQQVGVTEFCQIFEPGTSERVPGFSQNHEC